MKTMTVVTYFNAFLSWGSDECSSMSPHHLAPPQVCRHKAAPVAEGSGCVEMFECMYHGWKYGAPLLCSIPCTYQHLTLPDFCAECSDR